MSTQKGIIKLKGSMDGLTFYKAYGKDLVRRTNGPSKKQIMSGANFQRTRENISEFGGCSRISKSFRTSLFPLKPFTDGQMGNRLTKLFKFVTLHDEGVRGKRPIKLSGHRGDFANFECNINFRLSKVIPEILAVSHNNDRTLGSVTIQGEPDRAIQPPDGATHFQFVHALSIVSDFIYNGTVKGYLPVEPTLDTKQDIQYSDYFSVEGVIPSAYNSTVSLSVTTPLPDTVSVLHAFGITFFQQVASVYYPLKQGHALKILEII